MTPSFTFLQAQSESKRNLAGGRERDFGMLRTRNI